jgi:anti-sigma B factor antagonist
MTPFELKTEETGQGVLVALAGELDISTGPQLEEELRRWEKRGSDPIVVDLRRLEFMDSSGLRTLIAADTRAREGGRRLVIVQGPDVVQRVFRVTRLDERLEIVAEPPSEEGAAEAS